MRCDVATVESALGSRAHRVITVCPAARAATHGASAHSNSESRSRSWRSYPPCVNTAGGRGGACCFGVAAAPFCGGGADCCWGGDGGGGGGGGGASSTGAVGPSPSRGTPQTHTRRQQRRCSDAGRRREHRHRMGGDRCCEVRRGSAPRLQRPRMVLILVPELSSCSSLALAWLNMSCGGPCSVPCQGETGPRGCSGAEGARPVPAELRRRGPPACLLPPIARTRLSVRARAAAARPWPLHSH
jgi:hypothetical protein